MLVVVVFERGNGEMTSAKLAFVFIGHVGMMLFLITMVWYWQVDKKNKREGRIIDGMLLAAWILVAVWFVSIFFSELMDWCRRLPHQKARTTIIVIEKEIKEGSRDEL